MQNITELPLSKDKIRKILNILVKKQENMGSNPILKDWLDIQNKIRILRRGLNVAHD
jgi:hypothetical protein